MTKIEKEQQDFETAFGRQFARLSEASGPFVGGMSNADRDVVLDWAYHYAWLDMAKFKPTETTLVGYWQDCLRKAVAKRKTWRIRRFDRWEIVSSKYLGGKDAELSRFGFTP